MVDFISSIPVYEDLDLLTRRFSDAVLDCLSVMAITVTFHDRGT
jgi:hypothetical protein